MKKLFKEVWKSFSKSKVILSGLIILIFLTSGIITLIFDVLNSFTTQYNTFKNKSVLHDVTMNTSLNLYGSGPDKYYNEPFEYQHVGDNKGDYKQDPNNENNYIHVGEGKGDYIRVPIRNIWTHIGNKNTYVDYIQINNANEFINLNKVLPSAPDNYFVKTKDLSNLLNINLNIGKISANNIQGDVNATLDSSGNNKLNLYLGANDQSAVNITQLENILDTYDSTSKTWSASNDAKKLYVKNSNQNNDTFKNILIDIETKKAYVKDVLTSSTSNEKNKYESSPLSFFELTSEDVAKLLGFERVTSGILGRWNLKLDKWILDGEIPKDLKGKTVREVLGSTTTIIPPIKSPFNLLTPIDGYELSKITIPATWFVYSQQNYKFTKINNYLNGITKSGNTYEVSNNYWTGYYNEYLKNISEVDSTTMNELYLTSYWTKSIEIKKVDYQGNVIKEIDKEGNQVEGITIFDNVNFIVEDLSLKITKDGQESTLQNLENLELNEESISKISNDKTSSNELLINSKALEYKNNLILKQIKNLAQIGIRETLSVNSNEDGATNVFHFINLGNENNEIDWNGIKIKQNVGKLIDTSLDNPIFKFPSNIDSKSKKVPTQYISLIIEQYLKGLSASRDYINPMISFNNYDYPNGNLTSSVASAKIIWMSINGNKDFNNIYGITLNPNNDKQYFILKSSITNGQLQPWTYNQTINSIEDLNTYIISNNLSFAPFDYFGNDLKIVGNNGWARQDTTYSDKYSIPFQYFLPNSEMIKEFEDAKNNPNKVGMEYFRDNLRKTLTESVKSLIPAPIWEALTEGVNTAFARYGFGDSLTPPAALTNQTIVRIALGTVRDAILSTTDAFMSPFLSNLLNGIKRIINPDGNTPIAIQKENFKKELNKLSQVLLRTSGVNLPIDTIVDSFIDNPSAFLDGLLKVISSINLDNAVLDIWNSFFGQNNDKDVSKKSLGTGDIIPAIYKNIYSTKTLLDGLKDIISATTLKDKTINDLTGQNIPILGAMKIPSIVGLVSLVSPQEGYELLKNNITEEKYTLPNSSLNLSTKSLDLKSVLSLVSVNALVININLGTLVGSTIPNQKLLIKYDPATNNYLELDMDLLWYLENYVFVQEKTTKSTNLEPMKLFGVDIGYFLANASYSFIEVKNDYNQVTMNENASKMAIVNEAYLLNNNKEVYKGNITNEVLSDSFLENKNNEKYTLDISGVKYLIVGKDFTVDYMYPVINSANITVNTNTQALVYVNQYGFDRIRRSNTAAGIDKYFLLKAINTSPENLQTKLNELVYEWETGNKPPKDININSNSNTYKLAYLANESSLLNPERSLRLTIIDDMFTNLRMLRFIVGILLCTIVAIVIIFVIRRYIGSRAKTLGILKAQGYSSWQIAGAICLFPLFVSVIGGVIGYVVGLVSQFGVFDMMSIFWTMPIHALPFNWLTFLLAILIPVVALCALTVLTTLFFLHKNKSLAMMNGSMEVNDTRFAHGVRKLASKTSVKNKFSISLALGSIGKLIALFISSIFTAGVVTFFVSIFRTFNDSIDKTYKNRNFTYQITYQTPTKEGGEVQQYVIGPNSGFDISNMLYVPVGSPSEGYTYLSNYFKPGYSPVINANNKNGIVDINDTTTPHIFTKASLDMTVKAAGLSINVWNNLYNAIPESQRASIISSSQVSNKWLEWTQEGQLYEYNGKKYITRFINYYNKDGINDNIEKEQQNLALWDENTNDFVKDVNGNIVILKHFKFVENEENPENSNFKYGYYGISESDSEAKEHFDSLEITGTDSSEKIRATYRQFLVFAYNLMTNCDPNSENLSNSLLDKSLRSPMPKFQIDYFISPGALLMSKNKNVNDETFFDDETFTYLQTTNIANRNMTQTINGYKENSKFVKIVDDSGRNLIAEANKFMKDQNDRINLETKVYPLIINKVVAKKYSMKINDTIELIVSNSSTRYQDHLKDEIEGKTNNNKEQTRNKFTFKIIGISSTYINEEWTTSQSVANILLGLNEDKGFNGSLTNNEFPISLVNNLPLYSYNGYWSANNKIFNPSESENLNANEIKELIDIYKQLIYNEDIDTHENISILANNIKNITGKNNDWINNKIKEMIGINDLNLTYVEGGDNFAAASQARRAINWFVNIYTDNSLYGFMDNAVSNGVEKEYVSNASKTIDDTLTLTTVVTFLISLTVLVLVTSMIINENERNIAIFGILGYTTREKLIMFFSIYVPIVVISIAAAALIVWAIIPAFLSTILASTSILLPMNLSIIHVLIASGILIFIFAITCMVSWIVQGKIKPITLLKEV